MPKSALTQRARQFTSNLPRPHVPRQRAVTMSLASLALAAGATGCGGEKIPTADLSKWDPGQVPAECTSPKVTPNPDVAALNAQVRIIAEQVRAAPGQLPAFEGELCDAAATLDPAIAAKTAELQKVNAQLAAKSGDRAALRKRKAALEAELKPTRGSFSTARVVLRINDVQGEKATPAYWESRIAAERAAVQAATTQPTKERATAKLLGTSKAVGVQSRGAAQSVTAFVADQSNLALDKRDWLDEMAKSQKGSSKANADSFAKAASNAVSLVRTSTADLLSMESTSFQALRADLQRIAPAHNQIPGVISSAENALSSLNNVEYWLRQRNYYSSTCSIYYSRMQGAPTQQDYDYWLSQYNSCIYNRDHAANQAEWSKQSAQRHLNQLNDGIHSLDGALDQADIPHSLSPVDQWFDNYFWDTYERSRMENQVRDRRGQLVSLRSTVDARYNHLSAQVNAQIDSRIAQLEAKFPSA